MPDPTSRSGQIPIVQAAKLLMITEQWVRQLIRKGYIEKVARGEVGLVNAVQGYIRFLKDEERRVSKSAAANAVQTARAREIELRIAKEEARLIDYDEAMAVLDVVVGTYKAQFAGLPACQKLVLKNSGDSQSVIRVFSSASSLASLSFTRSSRSFIENPIDETSTIARFRSTKRALASHFTA